MYNVYEYRCAEDLYRDAVLRGQQPNIGRGNQHKQAVNLHNHLCRFTMIYPPLLHISNGKFAPNFPIRAIVIAVDLTA